MKRFVLIASLLVALGAVGDATAKSYRITQFHSDVVIAPDGSATITESLTYQFDGKFSYAFRAIPLRSGDRLSNIRVSSEGNDYRESATEAPGTFSVARRGDGLTATWYYRAENETRTFKVTYVISGIVRRYPDVGEYYHKIIGDGNNARMEEVTARVQLPGPPGSTDDVQAWAHGPLHGDVTIESGTVVTARVSPLPRGRFYELRVLMPEDRLSGMSLTSGDPHRESVMRQEALWVEEANAKRHARETRRQAWLDKRQRQKKEARTWFPVTFSLALVGLGVWFMLFLRVGKPHDVEPRLAPGRIPSSHPPAIVAQLMAGGVAGPAMVATLLDLAERGYLTVEEKSETKSGWFGREVTKSDFHFTSTGENPGQLLSFEADLLDFVFNKCGDGREFRLSDIKKTARKRRTEFRRWFTNWVKEVKKEGDAEGLFEPADKGAIALNVVMGIVILGVGVLASIRTDSPSGVPGIAGGAIQLVLSAALTRRTEKGQRLMREWKGFRKHLKRMSRGLGGTSIASSDWSRYVAIAIIFGMHKKVIEHLQVDGSQVYSPMWYMHHGTHPGGLDNLASGFSSMIDSVSSSMSSATGAGGGASGGGGGGGGGGSAGAG